MSLLAPVLAAMLLQSPPIQRPTSAPATTSAAPAPAAPAPTSAAPAPAAPTAAPAPTTAPAAAPAPAPAPITPAPATPDPIAPAPATPAPITAPTTPLAPAAPPRVEKPGPPFYTDADMQALRKRYGLEADPPKTVRRPRFRCWVADPTCGFVVELNATSAYAYRMRQGSVETPGDINRWNSARIQYDIWFSIPTVVETRGKFRYTRLSLGPKGGVIASDSKDIWGNVGLAGRYWFSRKAFAPSIEFTTALVFKLAGTVKSSTPANGTFDNLRGPIGIAADVGVGLGGFGSLIVGGQYDAPLSRTDVPDSQKIVPSGMFYIGFRGNIVWGAPAALAVGTHALTNRYVTAP